MTDAATRLSAALVDRYVIERELGAGGMATVYLAHDLRHDRHVALKVLRPDLTAVLGAERFLQEIRITAGLDHPHILTLIDSGADDGFLWYVLPYVRGESLRLKLEREKQLGLDEALAITRQIASALERAHQRGVIHRDIKPENILLHEGEAMLADFGIALAVKEAGGNRLTETGLSLGTPQYMSPEQATGERALDARCDIYSLGAVLYEMLAGEPPHTGPTAQAIIAKLLTERPTRIRTVRDTVPESVDRAVAKALARTPADRYASAGDFVAALRLDATARGRAAARGVRRRALAGVTIVVLALAGLGVWPLLSPGGATLDPNLIAIFPFRVTSADSSLRYLGEGMVDLLSAMYTGEGGPRAVDPRTAIAAWKRHGGGEQAEATGPLAAHDLGAGSYLLGSVVSTGSRLVLSASVGRPGENVATVQARVEGAVDSLTGLLDALVGQLLLRDAGLTGERAVGLSASLEATRAYVAGRAANRRSDWNAAALQFARAIALDSSFTLAALGLTEASAWTDVPVAGLARVQELAWTHRSALSPRDQALLAGYTGGNGPAPHSEREALAAWESAVSRYPDLAEAWIWLGERYLHDGRLLGYEDHLARARRSLEMASSLDSESTVPLHHRIDLAAARRDTVEAERLLAQLVAHDSTSPVRSLLELYVAEGVRDSVAVAAAIERFVRTGHTTVRWAVQYFVRMGRNLQWLDTLMTLAIRAAGSADLRAQVERERMSVLLDLGRPEAAVGGARRAGVWDDATAMATVLYYGVPREAAGDAWRRQARLALAPPAPTIAGRRAQYAVACLVGQWVLAYGPRSSAASIIAVLRRGVASRDALGEPEANPACLALVEAMAAVRDARPDRVALVVRLDSLLLTVPSGMSWVNFAGDDGLQGANLVVAGLLERAGLAGQAYRALRRGDGWDGTPWPQFTFMRELGRLAALAGEREAAEAAYRHYLAIRYAAEPALIPQRDSVRAELAALEGRN